jgi:2-phosphosulfolactate phosphatase
MLKPNLSIMQHRNLEACFSPALYSYHENKNSIVVVIDVLRATSSICAAFANGVVSIIPVEEKEEALKYKKMGFMVAAERDGYVLDFADFGNSPFNFAPEKVKGRTIVYCTTNGTKVMNMASSSYLVTIGSYMNLSALSSLLINQKRDVILLCAGWKNRINIEDTLCAGAFAEKLLAGELFKTNCDSIKIALDLWGQAKDNLLGYIEKSAQRSRLRDKDLDDCLELCHTLDYTDKIPVLWAGKLVDISTVNLLTIY